MWASVVRVVALHRPVQVWLDGDTMTRKYRDRNGRTIRPGDIVRVVGTPDLAGCPPETHRVFRRLVGTYRRVLGFDKLGNADLVFRIRAGRDRGLHVVGIEPRLLKSRDAGRSNVRAV